MLNEALGMAETRGLVGTIEAADAMTKAVNVVLIGYEKIGFGLITVMIRGDADAVKASADAGVTAAADVGQAVPQRVTPRPHIDVEKTLPRSLQDASKYTSASVVGI